RDRPPLVALLDRVILELQRLPRRVHLRVAVHAELRHEPAQHAEEPRVIEVAELHEMIEAVDSAWRPIAMREDREVSLARLDGHLERVRRRSGDRVFIGLDESTRRSAATAARIPVGST